MSETQKWQLNILKHNTGLKFTYGEVKPFFDDGFSAMAHEAI